MKATYGGGTRLPLLSTLLSALLCAAVATTAQPPLAAAAQSPPAVEPGHYHGMPYRMVGPYRGGRTETVTGVPGQPHTFLAGFTGGGVWRSDDAGHYWSAVTDGFLTSGSVGAVAVAPSDPDVVYLGTGSTCIRGNVSMGRGIWKSEDGGDTWRFSGLPESGAVGRILVDPSDPKRVYVAALGHPFRKNAERGVYRSEDGGASWEPVLAPNDSTGAVELAMDPRNPRVLYAGLWRAERKPWTLISGGPEGGLYKTLDGGDSWTKLAGGLPEGVVGKVGVTVSPANPDRVWAMVEASPGNGLYRSDDAGRSWTFLTGDDRLAGRAFYYHHVVADPRDPNTVYVLNVGLWRSVDGGESFDRIPVPHGDVHDLWIDPDDPEVFVAATDGGASVTLNNGRTFSSVYNQPTAELYDVMVDNGDPYRIYGSQQDNTAISVPVRPAANALRPQEEWAYAAGCETGPVAFHPDHPDVLWGGCYGGVINRMVVSRDTRRNMNLYPTTQRAAPEDLRYRFQWVAPIVVSPHDPKTVYHASQYVHRTRDGGFSWETISPDLTTDDPAHQQYPGGPLNSDHSGVEVFNTIFALAPDPHDPGTIWAGTDDGRVHITRDDGDSWREITPPEMPRLGTVNRIEASSHSTGRAFLAVHRYRMGDYRPYVFRTNDHGRSWELLTNGHNGIPADHWVRVVREDPTRGGLLYAGTEFGVYVSFDDGRTWQSLQNDLPATPITDLKVQRDDLVLATQGRSFWVLDDLTPLRELAEDPAVGTARLFTPRDATRGGGWPPLNEVDYALPDRLPPGALLHYTLTGSNLGGLRLEVLDASDTVVASWAPNDSGSQDLADDPGFHRVAWSLRYPGGVKAPPGRYRARLTWDGGSQSRSFRVLPDSRDPDLSLADYQAQFHTSMEVRDTLRAVEAAVAELRDVRTQARDLVAGVRAEGDEPGRLPVLADSLEAQLNAIERELTAVPDSSGPAGVRQPPGIQQEYGSLMYHLNSGGGYGAGSTEGRPTAGALERKRDLDREWARLRDHLLDVMASHLAAFNAEAHRLGLDGVEMETAGRNGPAAPGVLVPE